MGANEKVAATRHPDWDEAGCDHCEQDRLALSPQQQVQQTPDRLARRHQAWHGIAGEKP